MADRRDVLTVGLILGAVAVGLIALGGYAVRYDLRLTRRMRRVSGRVAETRTLEDEGHTKYMCVVEFVPEGASAPVRLTRPSTYGEPRWTIGEACRVRYDPLDPSVALVDDDQTGHRSIGLPFLGVGVIVLLIAAFLFAASVLGPTHPFVRFGSQFFGDGD